MKKLLTYSQLLNKYDSFFINFLMRLLLLKKLKATSYELKKTQTLTLKKYLPRVTFTPTDRH